MTTGHSSILIKREMNVKGRRLHEFDFLSVTMRALEEGRFG